jgi:hypothetical protein
MELDQRSISLFVSRQNGLDRGVIVLANANHWTGFCRVRLGKIALGIAVRPTALSARGRRTAAMVGRRVSIELV